MPVICLFIVKRVALLTQTQMFFFALKGRGKLIFLQTAARVYETPSPNERKICPFSWFFVIKCARVRGYARGCTSRAHLSTELSKRTFFISYVRKIKTFRTHNQHFYETSRGSAVSIWEFPILVTFGGQFVLSAYDAIFLEYADT